MTRAEAADELREAGWPSVADDVDDGLAPETILRRLRAIGEEDSDAAYIVGMIAQD